MKNDTDKLKDASLLRQKAEERLKKTLSKTNSKLSESDTLRLVHELQVHQIELELQNEELRRAQLELEVSQSKYFDLFDLAPIGYLTLNEEGIILEANLTASFMLSTTRDAIIKRPLSLFVISEDRDICSIHTKKLLDTGEPQIFETKLQKKAGKEIWTEMTLSSMHDAKDKRLYLVTISDITDRKREEEVQKALMKTKSDFTSMVTHELRSPLGAIQMGLTLIFDESTENLNKSQLEILISSKNCIDRLIRIINNTLDLQKLNSGTVSLDIQKYDINNLVHEIKSSMIRMANEKNLYINVRLDESLPLMFFDRDKIIQVLVNLVSNAIKFTDKGGITISTAVHGNEIVISVKDEGIGIEEKDLSSLFIPFHQLGNAKNYKGKSSGLGLSISKTIIEAHGGKIWAESKIGVGSVFCFSLPSKI